MGPRALAISLPFSCVLGLVSSMIASTMGKIIDLLYLHKVKIYKVNYICVHWHELIEAG